MAKLDLSALPDRPLHSEAVVRMLPGLDIAASVSSGMRMERTRNLLADGDDDVALMICTQGAAMMSQRAREATLARGDAVLMTNGELGQITYPSLARMICVRMPREALAPMVPDLDDALLRPIRRDGEALRLLTSYSHGLLANALTRPDLRHLAATHMRDLVARTLGASGEAASSGEVAGIGAARLQAIKAEIMRRLGRHDLSVAAVAVSQGVGPRYVQLLFEIEGTTFSAFVLGRRLAWAYRLLADPRGVGRPISAIAFEVGFGDLSYFNRTFRRRYGATPSDVRATALRRRSISASRSEGS
ncbi:transcriptional regulator, AraC family [Rhizobiales bacterium GAS188]|nr:transcriptional regulator, AraC family [Rhizobiales bacterium GAS188]